MNIFIDARMAGIQGGHGRYLKGLINGIIKLNPPGCKFTVLVKDEDKSAFNAQDKKFWPKNCYFLSGNFHWYGLKEQRELPKILNFLKPDIVHFPHWNIPLFWKGRFIVTIHDLIVLNRPNQRATTKNFMAYWIKFLIMKKIIKKAVFESAAIIAPTNYVKQDICKRFPKVNPEKIKIIYEGVAQESEFAGAPLSAESVSVVSTPRHNAEPIEWFTSDPYFLYVGTAYPHKNLEFLIKTFLEWKRTNGYTHRLVLIGAKSYFYDKLKKFAVNKLNSAEDEIKFLHSISDTMLAEAYRNALAFVFPSIEEGFGLPPVEAMAHGAPVISSDAPCMKEVLGGAALYFSPTKPETLKNALNLICEYSEKDINTLKKTGAELAKKYKWSDTARQTLELYKKVLPPRFELGSQASEA